MNLVPNLQAIVQVSDRQIHAYEATITATERGQVLHAQTLLKRAKRKGQLPELDRDIHTITMALYDRAEPLFLNCTPQTLSANSLAFEREDLSGLVLEITERARFHSPLREIAAYLQSFRARGLRLAIDDFGTGWSNFDRISVLTPEYIKLDHSLIADLNTNESTQDLIAGLLAFTARTRTLLVAEGVETEEQAKWLQTLGVPLGQGYYYERPIPITPALVASVKG